VSDGDYYETTPIRPATTVQAAIARLRAEIYDGALPPGTRLRQSEIAARFGVSTTPVREALSALQAEGLVGIDPHRGAVVFKPGAEDVAESFEIRRALESLAVEKAIPNLDDAALARLQDLIDSMREASDYQRWEELNESFHRTLYQASGRPRLLELIASMRRASRFYIHLAVSAQLPNEGVDAEHQAILDACKERNVRKAKSAIERHIASTARMLMERLETAEPVGSPARTGAT
jgi:DNA-binding GntR family transcriptional regulator